MASVDLAALDEQKLADWLLDRRWFGSKARDVASIHVLDVGPDPRRPAGAVRGARRGALPGRHPRRLPAPAGRCAATASRTRRSATSAASPSTTPSPTRVPASCSAASCARAPRCTASTPASSSTGCRASSRPRAGADVRPIGAEQSNTSIVFDDALVLKAFRRVEAGDNPELEMLRFLSERDFPHIAELGGWYEYEGELMDATFGVVQRFVPDAATAGSWRSTSSSSDPRALRRRACATSARSSGACTRSSPSDPADPAFAPEEPSDESLALLTATIDEEIERVFVELPDDRGARADRRPRRRGPRPPAAALARRRARQAHPHPRRPAPRADHARCRGAGSSSTSRASPRARCSSAAASARRCATSPACCARFAYAASASELQRGRARRRRAGRSVRASPS